MDFIRLPYKYIPPRGYCQLHQKKKWITNSVKPALIPPQTPPAGRIPNLAKNISRGKAET